VADIRKNQIVQSSEEKLNKKGNLKNILIDCYKRRDDSKTKGLDRNLRLQEGSPWKVGGVGTASCLGLLRLVRGNIGLGTGKQKSKKNGS